MSILLLGAAAALGAAAPEAPSVADAYERVMAKAVAEAARLHAPGGAFAIVDEGGHLVLLKRLPGTFPAAAEVSYGKARTSALFRKPTRVFEEAIAKGRLAMSALEGFTPLQGGVPIEVNGRIVGALGVSGAMSAQQDDDIAIAAVAAAGSEPTPRTASYLPKERVAAAFAKGDVLVNEGGFMVHASRRDAPGLAEVHLKDTDIIYVLEGTATFVTGGKVVDGKPTADLEIRGMSIEGGVTHTLAKGDVIVVPSGVPHWFKKVEGTFLYYVVKVP
jgi:glc operon protein GlcG